MHSFKRMNGYYDACKIIYCFTHGIELVGNVCKFYLRTAVDGYYLQTAFVGITYELLFVGITYGLLFVGVIYGLLFVGITHGLLLPTIHIL